MARISQVTTGTPISSTVFGNALQADYVSQTDTTGQALASDLTSTSGKAVNGRVFINTNVAGWLTALQAALDDGTRPIDLLLTGESSYATTITIKKHGQQLHFLRGSIADRLKFTGSGPAIKTVADSGNYITGVRIYDPSIASTSNNNCTYGILAEDAQDIAIYNPRLFSIPNGYAIGYTENAGTETCHFDIYHIQAYACKHGVYMGANTFQLGIHGGQINGTNGSDGAGTYGIRQVATSPFDLYVSHVTLNSFENCLYLENDKWTINKCQMESSDNGLVAPNFFYRGTCINPTFTDVTGSHYSFGSGGRMTLLDSETPLGLIPVAEKAGAPAGGDFQWLTQQGFVYDTTGDKLYFRNGAGVVCQIAVTEVP
jgi:hypothetical protein